MAPFVPAAHTSHFPYMKKHIAIVLVNWNGKDDTVIALTSIRKMDTFGYKVSVIVVDNGSTNDSVAVIKKVHPWAMVLTTGKNLGFTGGNNAGIRKALTIGADFIWLLNNDIIADRRALALADAFRTDTTGIAGSKIYFAPGREYHHDRYSRMDRGRVFWYAGGLIDWENMYASHRGVDEVDRGQYDVIEETPFITGCSMMIRRGVIEKIGVLDEKFYLYLEDLDFCLRAKKAGFSLLYYPKSIIWHVNAGSSGSVGNPLHEYYLTRNRLLIGMRYATVRTKIALLREGARFLVTGGSSVKRKAVWDALTAKYGNQYEPKKF